MRQCMPLWSFLVTFGSIYVWNLFGFHLSSFIQIIVRDPRNFCLAVCWSIDTKTHPTDAVNGQKYNARHFHKKAFITTYSLWIRVLFMCTEHIEALLSNHWRKCKNMENTLNIDAYPPFSIHELIIRLKLLCCNVSNFRPKNLMNNFYINLCQLNWCDNFNSSIKDVDSSQ